MRNGLLLLSETIKGFFAVVFAATVYRAEGLSCGGSLLREREEWIHGVCVSCQGVVKNLLVFFLGSLHRRFIWNLCFGSRRLSGCREWVVNWLSWLTWCGQRVVHLCSWSTAVSRVLSSAAVSFLSKDSLEKWCVYTIAFRLLMFLLENCLESISIINVKSWRPLSSLVISVWLLARGLARDSEKTVIVYFIFVQEAHHLLNFLIIRWICFLSIMSESLTSSPDQRAFQEFIFANPFSLK